MLSYKLLQDVQSYLKKHFDGDGAAFDYKAELCDLIASPVIQPESQALAKPLPRPESFPTESSAKRPHLKPLEKIRESKKNSGKAPEMFGGGAVYSMPAPQAIADGARSSDIGELNRRQEKEASDE